MKYLLRVSYKDMNTGDIYFRDYDYKGCLDKKSMKYIEDREKVAYANEKPNEGVMNYDTLFEIPETVAEAYYQFRNLNFPVDNIEIHTGFNIKCKCCSIDEALENHRDKQIHNYIYEGGDHTLQVFID